MQTAIEKDLTISPATRYNMYPVNGLVLFCLTGFPPNKIYVKK